MISRMQQRRGSASQWTAANTVLAAGEMGFETDTNKFKIGDGLTEWNDLPYFVNTDDIESGLLDTDEVSEGTINLYFTDARAQSAVAGDISNAIDALDTDDIEEGTTNLYFTNQRAIDAVKDNVELDDLSDVDTTGVTDGDALVYDTATTSWVPGSVAIDALNDINDVNITTPTNGEVLAYENGNWVNQEASGGGIKDIVTDSDIVILPGTSWTTQTSIMSDAINSVDFGNNVFVAVGASSFYSKSTNGTTWTTGFTEFGLNFPNVVKYSEQTQAWLAAASGTVFYATDNLSFTDLSLDISVIGSKGSPVTVGFRATEYGDNKWVIGGSYGQLLTSTDTITWTTQTSNFGTYRIESIAYGDDLWVAGGDSGQLRTSTDATTWVTQNSNFGNTIIRSIAYGNNLWVAGGHTGQLRTSTDAINWTTQTSGFGGIIRSIVYADNFWVYGGATEGGSGSIVTSTDTINWTVQDSNFGASIAYGNDLLVAGGAFGVIKTSSSLTETILPNKTLSLEDAGDLIQIDSSSDTTITIPSNDSVAIPVKTQVNIVRAGTGDVVIESEQELVETLNVLDPELSAVAWVTQNSNFGNTQIRSVAYGDNLWVAGGYQGQLRTSTNTITWVTQTSNFGNTRIDSIAYGDNLWVAVGGFPGQIRTSTNATTWVTQTSNFENTVLQSIAYGDNLWVAGGGGGQLRTSTNAITWVTQTSNFGNTIINSITYGDNLWVAGDSNGQLRTSTDAVTWVTQTSNFGAYQSITSIAHGEGTWVAGGDSGRLRTSTDAVTWVTQNSNFDTTLILSIAYGDGLWVAGGYTGQLRTSTNAITWTTQNSNFGNTGIRSIAYGDNLWVAAGGSFNSSALHTSENIFDQVDVFGDAVTLNSSSGLKLRDQWSVATAIKTGTDEWLITGDLSE
jgi:hypothetical protein